MLLTKQNTEIHTWFERDRAHVHLTDIGGQHTIVEWRDGKVEEAVTDGLLDSRDWHGSALKVANDVVNDQSGVGAYILNECDRLAEVCRELHAALDDAQGTMTETRLYMKELPEFSACLKSAPCEPGTCDLCDLTRERNRAAATVEEYAEFEQ